MVYADTIEQKNPEHHGTKPEMTDVAFLLEPWSALASIALIGFMPRDIKIAVNNNRIEFFSSNVIDRLYRTMLDKYKSGYSRTAVLHFKEPIAKAIEWHGSQNTLPVFIQAHRGLTMLKKLYSAAKDDQSLMVTQLLNGYISSLKIAIKHYQNRETGTVVANTNIESDSSESSDEENARLPSDNEDGYQRRNSTIIPIPASDRSATPAAVSSMRHLWKPDEIDIVISLFKLLGNDKDESTRRSRVETIQKMIDSKHEDVVRLIAKQLKSIE